MKNKTFRLTMLGVLFSGLLLMGIGIGVGLGEFTRFTYGGEQLLPSASPRRSSFELAIPQDGTPIEFSLLDSSPGYSTPSELITVVPSEAQAPGSIHLDVDYISETGDFDYYTFSPEECAPAAASAHREPMYVRLNLFPRNPLPHVLAYTKQILSDIRQDKLCSYYTAMFRSVTVTVHPSEVSRIHL